MSYKIDNIKLEKLPKGIYELSWNLNDRNLSKFFTARSLLTFANNKRVYPQLSQFISEKIRSGDY